MIELSVPQHKFLTDNHKFKAYVAGLGCVHPETRIHTEHGLMRICDISVPTHVLSWNEKSQQFQLSLASPSFPKGNGGLVKLKTKKGVTVTSSHHGVMDINGEYVKSIDSINNNIDLKIVDVSKLSLLDMCKYNNNDYLFLYQIGIEKRLQNDHLKLINDCYWDIFVMDTNNYVCENGLIHHNSGKTWAGCSEIVHHFCKHPLVTQGYFAPTYTLIRDIFYPTIEECSAHYGFKVKVLSANKEVDFYRNGTYYGTVICRTIDNPANIVGFKIGNALVDELDILPKDKAELAWNKIIARLRWNDDSVKNGVAVTTTPEGFKFTYERFQVERLKQEQDKKSMYALIKASTYSNAHNLPSDYIQSMIDTYPSQLISAYLNGEFVNMTSGSVFPAFDRELSNSTETVNGDENIAVGMDFNVYNCSASISVMRYGKMHIVDEFHHITDTPEMCVKLRERYPNNKITVYPDASGGASKSINASLSDLNILRQAGFTVLCRDSNPFVRDRINATNKMILDNNGERHLFINTSKCPETTLCFEQLVYDKNGAPDKTSGKDHLIDAATYPIAYNFPITAPKKQIITNTVKTRNNW